MQPPDCCPVCNGTDLASERPIFDRVGMYAKDKCYRRRVCENCDAEWIEVFGYEDTTNIITHRR